MPQRGIFIVCVALVVALSGCTSERAKSRAAATQAGQALENPRGSEGEGDFVSPVLAKLVDPSTTEAFRGSDGRYHVVYELVLTNAAPGSATVDEATVTNGVTGAKVLSMSGSEMVESEALREMNRAPAKDSVIPPSTSRVLLLNAAFISRSAIPNSLVQRLTVTAVDPVSNHPSPAPTRFAYVAARLHVSSQAPPVISPPLGGDGWLASDGCCEGNSHHINAVLPLNGRLLAAERFAIDWIRIDAQGRLYVGDRANVRNWFGYGAKVLAVANGTVVEARDGLPDAIPPVMPDLPLGEIPGNDVVIDIGGSRYAVYAHLKPGSVAVKRGQRVRTGDVVGLLGNSGGSSAPHLHFHLVSGPSGVTSDGVPYVFDEFSLAGASSLALFTKALLEPGGRLPERAQLNSVRHTDELPLNYTIVDFP